jgi:hypothetical protein
MRDTNSILKNMMAAMERDLQLFYRAPMDRSFRPKLEDFLRHWEENFAPYITVKFDYLIDGQHLDIHATIPQLPKFVIDMRKRSLSVLDIARDF